MKNSKKISRENLKSIKGGFKMCNAELPNFGCGDPSTFCCGPQGCRRISDLPPGSCVI